MNATMKTIFSIAVFYCLVISRSGDCSFQQRLRIHLLKRSITKQYNCRDRKITNITECQRIMSHPLLQDSMYYLVNQARDMELQEAFSTSRVTRDADLCPTFDSDYLRNNNNIGARSLSPYKKYPQVDRFRIPEMIHQARCLCRGCIDAMGRKQTETRSFVSKPLTVSVPVLKSINGGPLKVVKETIAVGCTCVIPRYQNS